MKYLFMKKIPSIPKKLYIEYSAKLMSQSEYNGEQFKKLQIKN